MGVGALAHPGPQLDAPEEATAGPHLEPDPETGERSLGTAVPASGPAHTLQAHLLGAPDQSESGPVTRSQSQRAPRVGGAWAQRGANRVCLRRAPGAGSRFSSGLASARPGARARVPLGAEPWVGGPPLPGELPPPAPRPPSGELRAGRAAASSPSAALLFSFPCTLRGACSSEGATPDFWNASGHRPCLDLSEMSPFYPKNH